MFPITTAYIDPSTVSIVAVSVAGVVGVIGGAIFVFVRKAKKKVAQTLHIDENANKEVEEDLVINSDNSNSSDN